MPGRPDPTRTDSLGQGERAGRGALAVLSEIARLLNSRVDVESAFDEVLRLVTELLGLRTAWLFLQGPAGRRLVFAAAHGLPPALEVDEAQPLRHGTCDCFYRFYDGELREAVNVVECSRLQEARGDKGGLVYHASVPLRASHGVLGVLNVAAEGESLFDEQALSLLTAVGEHLGTALERSRLFTGERRRAAAWEAVDRVVRRLGELEPAGLLTPEAVAWRFAEACRAEMGAGRVAVALAEGDRLRWGAVAVEAGAPLPAGPAIQPGDTVPARSLAAACWRKGRPHFGQRPARRGSAQPAAWAVLPMGIGRRSLGVVLLERTGAADWTDGERAALRSLADHLALALENARLVARARELARVEERHRLARDLHDAVSQNLFSLTMLLAAGRQHLQAGQPGEALRAVDEAQERARVALSEMRRLVREVRVASPPRVAPRTVGELAEALRRLASEDPLAGRMGVEVRWVPGRYEPHTALEPDRAETLVRVAHEALHNALRHAAARSVHLSLAVAGRRVRLVVRDDGRGFDARRARHGGGGLSIMAERCRLVGGGLRIRSRPGQGSRVEAWVPLEPASANSLVQAGGEPGARTA
ncbi:MAG TPA: GAF domain-containing protein [Limnochordales bacterium]